MNDKGVGAVFCLIAAILFCTRYITAAIFHIGYKEYSDGTFALMVDSVGPSFTLSAISLVIGLFFLFLSFYRNK